MTRSDLVKREGPMPKREDFGLHPRGKEAA